MNKPQIRFKGFDEEWEKTQLADTFTLIPFKPYIASPIIGGKQPIIQQGNNPILGYSNVTPCMDYSETVVIGDHTLSVYKPLSPFLVASDGIKILKSKHLSGNYFYFFLDKYKPITEGYKRHFAILCEKIGYYTPSREEEEIISNFLLTLDEMITEVEREITRLEKMKQASLQKMFSRPGATTPEIRFEGYTEPWSIRSVGSCFSEGLERGGFENLLSVGLTRGVYPTEDFIKTVTVKSFSNYKTVHLNDIVYNSMRMWQGASGVSHFNGIVSPAYTVLIPKDNVWSPFFAYLFKLPWVVKVFEANSQGLTKDTWNLKYPAISLIDLPVPKNIEEQKEIANYFIELDSLLSAKRQKLFKLRNIKQACLDKMFVNTSEL